MDKVSSAITKLLIENHAHENPVSNEELVTMTMIAYYDKTTETCQLNYHRDCTYHHLSGRFEKGKNSQKENSFTCILTIGDPRDLHFKLHRNKQPSDGLKEGPFPVDGNHTHHVFTLTHGSLFVLSPEDEKTVLRQFSECKRKTFWKHGNVYFDGDGMSIGLVFRVTTTQYACDTKSGMAVFSESEWSEIEKSCAKHIKKMAEFVGSDEMHTAMSDIRSKYRDMASRKFN